MDIPFPEEDATYVLVRFQKDIPEQLLELLWEKSNVDDFIKVEASATREMLVSVVVEKPWEAQLVVLEAFYNEGVTGAYYELHQIA
jgi:hypothetical protein